MYTLPIMGSWKEFKMNLKTMYPEINENEIPFLVEKHEEEWISNIEGKLHINREEILKVLNYSNQFYY